METAQTKVCRMCNRELPASEFYISKTTSDGLEARCKQCKKASERIRYAEKKKKTRYTNRRDTCKRPTI